MSSDENTKAATARKPRATTKEVTPEVAPETTSELGELTTFGTSKFYVQK